eukprot:TRINITY_DN14616_c0_g1_i1.p1 TRINITY_DN14616_c0_g1~~TRINITY_DN14616_c0_g1_i1.p1  ORF type:complete len:337 (+),score=122.45 TRINITY_DN14616_c0_g1_i1:68-1012(+)
MALAAYEQWVLKGGDRQVQTLATVAQLAMGYRGDLLDYTWKQEVLNSAVALVEYANGLVKQRHSENAAPIDPCIVGVNVIRIGQRLAEVILRLWIVGKVHWPWETPLKVRQLIVGIEMLKSALLLRANRCVSDFFTVLRAYFRSLPRGKRSGVLVPHLSDPRAPAPLPPLLTMWDVLQPLADTATILRPVLYALLLLLDHNKARPWRALLVSFCVEAVVFAVTAMKKRLDSKTRKRHGARRSNKLLEEDSATSRKLGRQMSRFRDYLLRDPLYMAYIETRVGPIIRFLKRLPLLGFFVEYYELRRHLYFETSGS